MNNLRRREIQNIKDKLFELQQLLEALKDQEQESFDNMPENLQEAEKGQYMESAIDNLDDAINSLDDSMGSLDEAAL